MTETGFITVQRVGGRWRDLARPYAIELDGVRVARVRSGNLVRIEVTTGTHEVRASLDWAGTGRELLTSRPDTR